MGNSLTIVDNRTGKSYEVPIVDGAIRAMDLRQIKTGPDDFGLLSYDPAFMNTASTRSAITFIDGDRGVLWYRGYPIEELAEHSTFLEVVYLLIHGDLPSPRALAEWTWQITLAAFAYRHSLGCPYVYPDNDLSYAGNFLNMLFKMTELKYRPEPALERALDVLFILHADHEQNCSTHAMRSVGSSGVDPYSAVAAAAAAALYGPLHGGANEQVLRMLRAIGSTAQVPAFIRRVKAGEVRLMGFGHRVYKNYDPRARIIKRIADGVFAATRPSPLLAIALELERIALQDEYFVSRHLYPNVDFYSGLIYEAMGLPVEMFPVLFAIPRTAGWLAQWQEMLGDPEQKIARPRQIYVGPGRRAWVPPEARG